MKKWLSSVPAASARAAFFSSSSSQLRLESRAACAFVRSVSLGGMHTSMWTGARRTYHTAGAPLYGASPAIDDDAAEEDRDGLDLPASGTVHEVSRAALELALFDRLCQDVLRIASDTTTTTTTTTMSTGEASIGAPLVDSVHPELVRLLEVLALASARVRGDTVDVDGAAQSTTCATGKAHEEEDTLTLSEASYLLEHLLQTSLQRVRGADVSPAEVGAALRSANALYMAIRLLTQSQQQQLGHEQAQTDQSPSPRSPRTKNEKRRVPFSSKGMYYSYSFALLVEAQKQQVAVAARRNTAVPTSSSSPAAADSAAVEAALILIDAALKVLLVDAAADQHPSATRPSSLMLVLVALYDCVRGCAEWCARCGDETVAVGPANGGRADQVLPFVTSAAAAWRAGQAAARARVALENVEGESHNAVRDATLEEVSWSCLLDFLLATATACVEGVVTHSTQTAPIQEALWLWQQVNDVCERARCAAKMNTSSWKATRDDVARLGSPLLQHRDTAALADTRPPPTQSTARDLWSALLTAPEASLRAHSSAHDTVRRETGPAPVYTVHTSRQERGTSEASLRVERELLRPFLSPPAANIDAGPPYGCLDGLLAQLEAAEEKGTESHALWRRQRLLEALLAPFTVHLGFQMRTSQDWERLALAAPEFDEQQDREDAHGDVVDVAVHSSLWGLLVARQLWTLAVWQDHGLACASEVQTLVSQFSRVFLLIGAIKRQLRTDASNRANHRRGGGGGGSGRQHARRSPVSPLTLEQVYAAEQSAWGDILSAVRDGSFSLPLVDAAHATEQRGAGHHADPVLEDLVLPLYDHSQWRAPTVNVFLAVLDQWNLRAQMRDVFRVVFKREAAQREAVLACLRRANERDAMDMGVVASEAEPAWRLPAPPALSMASCQLLLAACCTDDRSALDSASPAVYPFMAAQVVEYALFQLHWWRLQHEQAQQDAHEDGEAAALEGASLEEWRAWIDGVARASVLDAFAKTGETLPDEWQSSPPN